MRRHRLRVERPRIGEGRCLDFCSRIRAASDVVEIVGWAARGQPVVLLMTMLWHEVPVLLALS